MRTSPLLVFVFFLGGIASLTAQDFYDIDRIQEIRIHISQPNWADLLDAMRADDRADRLLCDVVIDGQRYEGAGARYKGNSSFNAVRKKGHNKLPLNIKLNYSDKSLALPGGYVTLKLANGFRDPSFIREALAYEIARDYMPAPRSNFAKVYINDEFLGLYCNSQSIDKKFLLDHFGEAGGPFVKCNPVIGATPKPNCPPGDRSSLLYQGDDTLCYAHLYDMKSDHGWRDLAGLAKALARQPEELENWLDVDQTLWMLAFNNLIVNLDSYHGLFSQNYYLYQDTQGVFHPIVWDMNLAFGGFRHAEESKALDDEQLQRLSPLLHIQWDKRPLIKTLLNNSLYRQIYLAHLRTMLEEHFANERYLERAKALQKMIDRVVKDDKNALYGYKDFQQNLEKASSIDDQPLIGISQLMKARVAYLMNHPLYTRQRPLVAEVEHLTQGEALRVEARVRGSSKVWLCYRHPDCANFKRVAMREDGGVAAEQPETIWAAEVDYRPGMHYYVIAEGERVARLSPERAAFEYYRVD
jgi:hypothetical protein